MDDVFTIHCSVPFRAIQFLALANSLGEDKACLGVEDEAQVAKWMDAWDQPLDASRRMKIANNMSLRGGTWSAAYTYQSSLSR